MSNCCHLKYKTNYSRESSSDNDNVNIGIYIIITLDIMNKQPYFSTLM